MTNETGHPSYRLLSGPDDASFCQKVSKALDEGYKLYGHPTSTFDGERVIIAQAVIWPDFELKMAVPQWASGASLPCA